MEDGLAFLSNLVLEGSSRPNILLLEFLTDSYDMSWNEAVDIVDSFPALKEKLASLRYCSFCQQNSHYEFSCRKKRRSIEKKSDSSPNDEAVSMEPPVVLSDDAIPSDVSDETVAVGFLPPGEAGKISDATGTFWYPFYDVLSNGWFSVCCGGFWQAPVGFDSKNPSGVGDKKSSTKLNPLAAPFVPKVPNALCPQEVGEVSAQCVEEGAAHQSPAPPSIPSPIQNSPSESEDAAVKLNLDPVAADSEFEEFFREFGVCHDDCQTTVQPFSVFGREERQRPFQ